MHSVLSQGITRCTLCVSCQELIVCTIVSRNYSLLIVFNLMIGVMILTHMIVAPLHGRIIISRRREEDSGILQFYIIAPVMPV